MLTGKDIVIVGQQAWDVEIGSNCKNIALELSKSNRVLYVNSPLDRITLIRFHKCPKIQKRINIIKGFEAGLSKINENLWVFYPDVLIESVNWIRIEALFFCLNKLNNRKFARAISKAITSLDFSEYLLFNDNDIFRSFHLKELLNPVVSIYYVRDNLVATPYWRRYGRLLEPKLIEKSDIVFSNSEFLRNYCARYNEDSYAVGQGCDLDLIRNTDITTYPQALRGIGYPVIGYIGALTTSRLDLELITCIARKRPQWSFVLVGSEDDDFRRSKLHSLSNVTFLGPQKLERIFQFINAFDVCINPQLVNELTVGNYPRKIDEYLAMGKPVVATKTEAMAMFEDYVSLASNGNEFLEMVEEHLLTDQINPRKKRIEFAYSHSWKNCVQQISDRLACYQSRKNS